jgi:uncharacterized membrane protein YagU involved in acid resistance
MKNETKKLLRGEKRKGNCIIHKKVIFAFEVLCGCISTDTHNLMLHRWRMLHLKHFLCATMFTTHILAFAIHFCLLVKGFEQVRISLSGIPGEMVGLSLFILLFL